MHRRDFLKLSSLAGLTACSERLPWQSPPVTVLRPGMELGHLLRDKLPVAPPSRTRECEVAILGSGIAGLTAGWRLAREGFKDFCLLTGPEPFGNAAGSLLGGVPCPRGAHYLPLPTPEATHIREMLASLGFLQGDPGALKPVYDERALVHAPEERLLIDGRWQEGLMPREGLDAEAHAQIERFEREMSRLRHLKGADGQRAFAIPTVASSRDPALRALDGLRFSAWLDREGYKAPALRAWLDYCCRDDYGAGCEQVSAWAGLHYFASRGGQAANAEDGALLTWPDGLNPLARALNESIAPASRVPGMALRVSRRGKGVEVLCVAPDGREAFTLRAKRVILAMPLHVAMHVVEGFSDFGFVRERDLPESASWLIANFLLKGFPRERAPQDQPAWDNVVQGSGGLGWVVATHQWIRQAKPERTVFTAYRALAHQSPKIARAWMLNAGAGELLDLAATDLLAAYGRDFWKGVERVEITLRGHAMASPTPGFLARPGIEALREADGPLLFAHADLSGLSLFEEATWWGEVAARKILSA